MTAPLPVVDDRDAVGWVLPTGLLKPLSLNDRMHHMAKARITRGIRRHVAAAARSYRIPAQAHVHVRLEYTPRVKRRRDTDSLWLTAKPAIDALMDAGVVPDDTSEFVTRHEPLIRPCDPRLRGSRLLLRVWVELDESANGTAIVTVGNKIVDAPV